MFNIFPEGLEIIFKSCSMNILAFLHLQDELGLELELCKYCNMANLLQSNLLFFLLVEGNRRRTNTSTCIRRN
jgi:hypothetical protein